MDKTEMAMPEAEDLPAERPRERRPPDVLTYLNFREFLKDYYLYRKERNSSFSYRVFSERCGMASPNYLKLIIDGDRNLTDDHLEPVAHYCDLSKVQSRYFAALVAWNQAKGQAEKEVYWSELLKLVPMKNVFVLESEQFKILGNWYVIAILEMMRLADFDESPEWFQRKLRLPVALEEIARSLELLQRAGLAERSAHGWQVKEKLFFHSSPLPSELIQVYHHQVGKIALEAIYKVPMQERVFNASTISIGREQLARFKAEVEGFQNRILQMASECEDADVVYQLNVQFFPLTK